LRTLGDNEVNMNKTMRRCMAVFALGASLCTAQQDLSGLVQKAGPSVVTLVNYGTDGNVMSTATGFFADDSGDVVTCLHVVIGVARTELRTSDGHTYAVTAKVALDANGDLVLLSSDARPPNTPPLQVRSALPKTGERIAVIGSPVGLEQTVSDGIVSSVRYTPVVGNLIQVTAPASPGSSGSPVLDVNGQVVGVVSFQFSQGQNLNFAVPGERVSALLRRGSDQGRDSRVRSETLGPADAIYLEGMKLATSGDYEGALRKFEKVLSESDSGTDALFMIGACKVQLHRWVEAERALRRAVRRDPKLAPAHALLGVVCWQSGRCDEAIASCRIALALDPNDAGATACLGLCYHTKKDYWKAIDALSVALAAAPGMLFANLYMGYSYYALGEYGSAVQPLKEALKAEPDDVQAHRALARVLVELERLEEAADELRVAAKLSPDDASVFCEFGAVLSMSSRFEQAKTAFKQALAIDSACADAHYLLGIEYNRVGDRDAAVREYEILKKLDKSLAASLFDLMYK
jgi:tetratricopeptide (TPR) repeat protein